MTHERCSPSSVRSITSLSRVVFACALGVLIVACDKSSSSGGDKAAASASADVPNLALVSADAPRAVPNSNTGAQIGIGGGGWDHHCDIAATRTCVEWAQGDNKAACDTAQGTYGAGPCMRTPLLLGTCVLATGTNAKGEPAPVKRMLYLSGAGGAMKADNAHALCDREQLEGVADATHMWKDGPAARK